LRPIRVTTSVVIALLTLANLVAAARLVGDIITCEQGSVTGKEPG